MREVSCKLYLLIGSSLVFTLFLINHGLDYYGKPVMQRLPRPVLQKSHQYSINDLSEQPTGERVVRKYHKFLPATLKPSNRIVATPTFGNPEPSNRIVATPTFGNPEGVDHVVVAGKSTDTTTSKWSSAFSNSSQIPIEVQSLIDNSVRRERERIQQELEDYPFPDDKSISDYLLEAGGQPVRAMVVTTWRSGSTFLGDILTAHPGTFYHYEPLLHFDIKTARSGYLAQEAVRTLSNLMKCNYTDLNYYLQYGRTHHWLFVHNEPLWKYCLEAKDFRHSYCWLPEFLNRFCPMFPFQSIKTVRLRLDLTRELVEDTSLNVKFLLLVRDPRGTMQSRKHRDWCPGNPDCDDPRLLCNDLVSDYHAFRQLNAAYPNRYKVYRYEDFSMDPFNNTIQLFNFFNFALHRKVWDFLDTHTTSNIGGVSSTFRNSKTAPFAWREKLTMDEVQDIQEDCDEALRLWGYNKVAPDADLSTFNPIGKKPEFTTKKPRAVAKSRLQASFHKKTINKKST